MSDPSERPQEPGPDWRALRRAERHQRRRERRGSDWGAGGAWIGGVILVGLGLLFLLRNYGVPMPDHWWAFFILLPAFAAFAAAWRLYGRDGAVTPAVIGPAIGGLVLTVLAISFLAGFEWGKLWPVILIVLGIGVLIGGFRRG
jgi:LiaF transmembrane domain